MGTKENRKAVLYVRTAVKEQSGHNTMAIQRKNLKNYCHTNGIKISKIYEEYGSANDHERKGLKEALTYLSEKKETTRFFIVTCWDRISRNFGVYDELLNKLKAQGITLIVTETNKNNLMEVIKNLNVGSI